MENECRTCLRVPTNLTSIYSDPTLIEKIEAIGCIQLLEGEDYPKNICQECLTNINTLYNFRKVIINSDKELRERSKILEKSRTKLPQKESFMKKELETVFDKKIYLRSEDSGVITIHKKKKINTSSKLHECKICGESFKFRLTLARHKRSQHVTHKVCSVCGASIRSDNLNKHIQIHFEAPIECKDCGRILKNQESLRSHMLLVHKDENYTCEICGKTIKFKASFKQHLKQHEDPNYGKSICPICGKHIKEIKKHLRSHAGARPYKCMYCKKGFARAYALKIHIRQHTNEKPYSCEHCGMAFHQKVSLLTHISTKHNV